MKFGTLGPKQIGRNPVYTEKPSKVCFSYFACESGSGKRQMELKISRVSSKQPTTQNPFHL